MSTSVVVGASSDIGRAIAVMLARRNRALQLWGRSPERLAATQRACDAAGAAATTRTVIDVRDLGEVRVAARAVAATSVVTEVVWAAGAFQWGSFDTADERVPDRDRLAARRERRLSPRRRLRLVGFPCRRTAPVGRR